MRGGIILHVVLIILIIISLEFILGLYRNYRRKYTYDKALRLSRKIDKPLLVIGSPKTGMMNSIYTVYGCGDECIDLIGCSSCKTSIKGDIVDVLKTKSDNSYVIFESCVLECIGNIQHRKKAQNEMKRVGGANCFNVRIAPTIYINLLENLRNNTNAMRFPLFRFISNITQYGLHF